MEEKHNVKVTLIRKKLYLTGKYSFCVKTQWEDFFIHTKRRCFHYTLFHWVVFLSRDPLWGTRLWTVMLHLWRSKIIIFNAFMFVWEHPNTCWSAMLLSPGLFTHLPEKRSAKGWICQNIDSKLQIQPWVRVSADCSWLKVNHIL